ncbi:MAG: DUF2470 domain-containing protein [Pseudomonadota bacterium]
MPLSHEDKARIIDHMNEDHADACLLYAHHYADRQDATAALLKDVQQLRMVLEITTAAGIESLSVDLLAPVDSAADAHHVLVDMVKAARA